MKKLGRSGKKVRDDGRRKKRRRRGVSGRIKGCVCEVKLGVKRVEDEND